MSNYKVIARKKGDKKWREAIMLDDYFGSHKYGVCFADFFEDGWFIFQEENGVIYEEEECEFKQCV
ncbi:hypothetical protein M0R04_12715 [Candidatus Dojkabacteria bacterium]|jgi:hypothetical protein|nr:hypothetical protein [Candidatus Dojkabacteria bacterium]